MSGEPERQYLGILAHVQEAAEIQKELGCTADEAYRVQSERYAARVQETEDERERAEKVIQFRPRVA